MVSRRLGVVGLAALLVGAPALVACIGDDEPDDPPVEDYTGAFTIHRNIDAYGDLTLFASDNPGLRSDRTVFTASTSPNEDLFWTLDAVVVGEGLREITLSVDFEAFGGCYFSGTTNEFQGTLDTGSCVIPTATGYVYFQQESPAIYQTANIFGVGTTSIEGRWLEEQNGYLITGSGSLYIRQHDQMSAIGMNSVELTPPHVADYRDPFVDGDTCIHAGVFGTGELVEGDEGRCSGAALQMDGTGFELYIDAGARLSFVPLDMNAPDDRIQGVVSPDGSALMAFTGNLAGLNTRYDIAFGEEVAFTNTFFWSGDGGAATLCTVTWRGPITTCE